MTSYRPRHCSAHHFLELFNRNIKDWLVWRWIYSRKWNLLLSTSFPSIGPLADKSKLPLFWTTGTSFTLSDSHAFVPESFLLASLERAKALFERCRANGKPVGFGVKDLRDGTPFLSELVVAPLSITEPTSDGEYSDWTMRCKYTLRVFGTNNNKDWHKT